MLTAPDANILRSPPPASDGSFLASGAPLPRDLLERGRDRVRIAALVLVATWIFVIIMNEGVARIIGGGPLEETVWAPRQSVLTLVGLVVSIGVAWLIPKLKGRPERSRYRTRLRDFQFAHRQPDQRVLPSS